MQDLFLIDAIVTGYGKRARNSPSVLKTSLGWFASKI